MKIVAKTIALAFAAFLAGCASIRTGAIPDGFVMLADAVPDAILEPRYYSTYNFIGDRIDGYEEPCSILSKESHPDWRGVTDTQFANRMLLREIMTAHGFKPIDEEWWHFTLKDEPYPDTYFDFPVKRR